MYLFLYLCAITGFHSAAVALLIHFISYFLFDIIYTGMQLASGAKFGLSLLPVMAMRFGCKTFVKFYSAGVFALIVYRPISKWSYKKLSYRRETVRRASFHSEPRISTAIEYELSRVISSARLHAVARFICTSDGHETFQA